MPITTHERTFAGQNGLVINFNNDVNDSDINMSASIISEFVHANEERTSIILNVSQMGVYSDELIQDIVENTVEASQKGNLAPKMLMLIGEGELQTLIEEFRRESPQVFSMPLIPRFDHGVTCMEMMVTVSKYRSKRTLAITS